MLFPTRTKYRKSFRRRGSMTGKDLRGSTLAFGSYGLKATTASEINSRQVEAARKAIAHCLKRGGKLWIRIYPDKPVTQKAAQVPMGSGKGSVEFYVAQVKPGRIIFEMADVTEEQAREALRLAAHKLPVRTKFINKSI